MQINTNMSLQAPAKPRWQEQHLQQSKTCHKQAPAKPQWQEQQADKHKHVTTSKLQASAKHSTNTHKHVSIDSKSSILSKVKHATNRQPQSPDAKSSI